MVVQKEPAVEGAERQASSWARKPPGWACKLPPPVSSDCSDRFLWFFSANVRRPTGPSDACVGIIAIEPVCSSSTPATGYLAISSYRLLLPTSCPLPVYDPVLLLLIIISECASIPSASCVRVVWPGELSSTEHCGS